MTGGLVLAAATLVGASDATRPHFHGGKLTPYEMGPPTMLISPADESELEKGSAIMRAIPGETTSAPRRLVMVRDIESPDHIVLARITDFEKYPRMVKGCDRCVNYLTLTHGDGTREIRSEYEIHALHMRFTYFMRHFIDSRRGCVTFNLDYDRQSDLDDSVGYWYVQPRGHTACRVYYSCDTKLRGWVPAPVYAVFDKIALKQATTWVHQESLKEWDRVNQQQGGVAARLSDLARTARDSLDMMKRRAPRVQRPKFELPDIRLPWQFGQHTSGRQRGLLYEA